MNDNAMAIAVLCSHLCVGEGVLPLEPREWSVLAERLMQAQMQPSKLLQLSRQDLSDQLGLDNHQAERILRLVERSAALSFEISKYENMGIHLITRADAAYPTQLKTKLGKSCPPIFYAAGDLGLLTQGAIGYVGSRSVSDEDMAFVKSTVRKTVDNGYFVVSGGAKGSDRIAEEEAVASGGKAIAYLSDSMFQRIKNARTIHGIQTGNLLLLSVVKPDAGFNTGIAMMRNKYIYAQSEGTIVIKADYNKGGTWAGAMENLKNEWTPLLCRCHDSYPGNKALIEKGAIPIDDTWDGDLPSLLHRHEYRRDTFEQISMFE